VLKLTFLLCFQVDLDVIEIDPEMVTIATDWFGFRADDRMKVHITDGLQYLQESAKKGRKIQIV